MAEIPILLLAAGHSERMGEAKQLLPWGESTLIEHQIAVLMRTGHPVVAVLGSGSERIRPLVERFPVDIEVNREWKRGMGTSIAAGVKRVMESDPQAKGILITLVDQPLVPPDHYMRMLSTFIPGEGSILVSRSGSGLEGVPALFDADYFRELSALGGEGGAKRVIHAHRENAMYLWCDEIGQDLDTPEDYKKLHTIFFGRS